MRRPLLLLALVGCSDDADLPPLTDATSLACPEPGDLPFRLASSGFTADNAQAIANQPRQKGEASDTIGTPELVASIYLADDAAPSGAFAFHGVKARTQLTNGLFSSPLPDQAVSVWQYADGWTQLGRTTTDANGAYDIAATAPDNGDVVYAMLEADGSCAEHYTYRWPAGTPVVVMDIDGTLTAADSELFAETGDPTYVQKTKTAAVELTQAWAAKGYPIVYLTARPHVYRTETRRWLRDLGFAPGPVITAHSVADAAAYKTVWVTRMYETFGWMPVAAYGNAVTDIEAYATQVPIAVTFIIGEHAGENGTVAIANDDYTSHIATYVAALPSANL